MSLLFLAGVFEFGGGLLHARNKSHGGGGWLKGFSVPKVGTVGYFCSVSLIASLGSDRFWPRLCKNAGAVLKSALLRKISQRWVSQQI